MKHLKYCSIKEKRQSGVILVTIWLPCCPRHEANWTFQDGFISCIKPDSFVWSWLHYRQPESFITFNRNLWWKVVARECQELRFIWYQRHFPPKACAEAATFVKGQAVVHDPCWDLPWFIIMRTDGRIRDCLEMDMFSNGWIVNLRPTDDVWFWLGGKIIEAAICE